MQALLARLLVEGQHVRRRLLLLLARPDHLHRHRASIGRLERAHRLLRRLKGAPLDRRKDQDLGELLVRLDVGDACRERLLTCPVMASKKVNCLANLQFATHATSNLWFSVRN